MRLVASIFTGSSINKKIDEVHENIVNQLILAPDLWLREDETSLLDFLADPNTSFRCSDKHKKIKSALMSGTENEPKWSDFGFKAGPECAMLNNRFRFIKTLSDSEIDVIESSNPKTQSIEKLSFKATSNSIALAIKYWWIVRKIEKPYRGMLASTSPVKLAIKTLWGNIGGGEMYAFSDFQHRLAHELDLDPNRLNTALWVIGQRMNEE